MTTKAMPATFPTVHRTPKDQEGLGSGDLVGRDPIEHLVLMEDHDDAYYAWKRAGVTNRVLVHLDAHLDFDWFATQDPLQLLQAESLNQLERLVHGERRWNMRGRPREQLINLGNYLYPTLTDELVRAVYWVVPDGFVEDRGQRKGLEDMFRRLGVKNPRGMQFLGWDERMLRVRLCGKPVTVCRLADLPVIDESVLLNIDTDFLVIRSLHDPYPYASPPTRVPWVWPEELVARLAARNMRSDFVTIAYSVQGGYTPPALRFLADVLARLIKGSACSEQDRLFGQEVREATQSWQRGSLTCAISAYERALSLRPHEPSVHYSLAELTYQEGSVDRAAAHYRFAVEGDPGYRLTEKRLSPVYQQWGMRDQAKAAYEMVLAFEGSNAGAHVGLGSLCAQAGQRDQAVSHYQKALAIAPAHPKALYKLGCLYARCRQWQAAESWLTQAARAKADDASTWFWLGYVCAKARRRKEAIAAYETAMKMGIRNLPLHWRLGGLYLRSGRMFRAIRQYRRALRMVPSLPLVLMRRLVFRLRNVARRSWQWDC